MYARKISRLRIEMESGMETEIYRTRHTRVDI